MKIKMVRQQQIKSQFLDNLLVLNGYIQDYRKKNGITSFEWESTHLDELTEDVVTVPERLTKELPYIEYIVRALYDFKEAIQDFPQYTSLLMEAYVLTDGEIEYLL